MIQIWKVQEATKDRGKDRQTMSERTCSEKEVITGGCKLCQRLNAMDKNSLLKTEESKKKT